MLRLRLFASTLLILFVTGCASTGNLSTGDNTPVVELPEVVVTPESAPDEWHHLDPEESPFYGISTERAYREILAEKKPAKKVVVAVIDSGVDTEHEDLRDMIWVNEDEIPGNDIDDDQNGYVDDIHGWNFIGGPDGRHVGYDTYEVTRELVRLQPLYGKADPDTLSAEAQKEYAYYQEVRSAYQEKINEMQQFYMNASIASGALTKADSILTSHFGSDSFTPEQVEVIDAADEEVDKARMIYLYFSEFGLDAKSLARETKNLEGSLRYGLNPEYNPRNIVGDNYDDPKETGYGNNNVQGPEPFHGTHVAGVIAAERGNGAGIDGIASNVEIMVLRAVPNGDERDKDVANAIRYAVDNGARIINMSFGKDYSPWKEVVDEAVRYAGEKDVLLVHAAGNDGSNIDSTASYPTRTFADGGQAPNWIEVGASSWKREGELVATFSNYGANTVDLFAPGVHMYSAIPHQEYDHADGTSAAAPVVSGVAALVMSYYPELTAGQVRDILLRSATPVHGQLVAVPGSDGRSADFAALSRTGGIVNAYKALLLAEQESASTGE